MKYATKTAAIALTFLGCRSAVAQTVQFVPVENHELSIEDMLGIRYYRTAPNTAGCSCTCEIPGLTVLRPDALPTLTTDTHPELLIYLPEMSHTSRTDEVWAEFALFQQEILNESLVDGDRPFLTSYVVELSLPESSGVIRLTLPEEMPALALNETYDWSFALLCDRNDFSVSLSLSGQIQRVAPPPELNSALSTTPLSQAVLFAKHGIWTDAAAILYEQRQANLHDPVWNAEWRSLLHSVGQEEFAAYPLIASPTVSHLLCTSDPSDTIEDCWFY